MKHTSTIRTVRTPFRGRAVRAPRRKSFEEFLLSDARVPTSCGGHGPYLFAGREALRAVVDVIDQILSDKLADAEVDLAGGAQFGKTILELNLAAYCTGQQFRNFGLYLPDDDLVEGVVDSKFRPDVVDQIGWFAEMAQVGKALNKSGRAVNRKGAFLVTDGRRKAVGMIRGLGKVPTTFSMDVAMMDEVDDIQPRMMKFVRGRLTASDLRFILKIGTQRVHGRGMNKAWKDGSQGVFVFQCPECGHRQIAEEEFPGIVRLGKKAENRKPKAEIGDGENIEHSTTNAEHRIKNECPQLTWSGDFKGGDGDEAAAGHEPGNDYFLGCVKCGAALDRARPIAEHRQADRLKQRHWSFRISQLAVGAIDLQQIVARFQLAVADPEEMTVFRCDVLGLPQSTAQALTPAILDRARAVEVFDLAPRAREGCLGVAGLDMGDRCWLWARETGTSNNPHSTFNSQRNARLQTQTRLLAAEKISAGDVVGRAISLFHRLGLSALFIDERPLVNEARTIALALNGLQDLATWPKVPDAPDAYVSLPGGLAWDAKNTRWLNLKCAVVRFTKTRLGAGIRQNIVFFEEGGQTRFVPCIECNRFETIDRVVREFLTPTEGVVEVVGVAQPPRLPFDAPSRRTSPLAESRPAVRETPLMLLPRQTPGHPAILDTVEAHLITGSEREKLDDGTLGDYVDGCDNHFLLADGYSKLAEIICANSRREQFAYERVERPGGGSWRRGMGMLV
ncbi:MAG: phage terminase large subunit family protein [Limisphaerales bacterium]